MAHDRKDLFPGALEMMVLRALSQEPRHGYALVQHIKRTSNDLLQVEEGSLYPALQRMLRAGWVKARWDTSPSGRRVRVYTITAAGRTRLEREVSQLRAHARRHQARPRTGEAMNFLRRLIERRQLERDLSDELRQHLDEKIEALVADGVPRGEAELRAHREFGNVTAIEERGREVWRWQLVEDAWADLRYATRQWRRTPAFTCAALVTLALGIGANTAVFSVVNGVVLQPLPFPSPERLVSVQSVDRRSGSSDSLSYPNFFDVRRSARTLSHISCYRGYDFTLTGRGLPVHLRGQIVSWEFFQTLEVAPALGRGFLPADEQPGRALSCSATTPGCSTSAATRPSSARPSALAACHTSWPASRHRDFRSRSSGSRSTRGRRWRSMLRPTRARRSLNSVARGCSTRLRDWLRESRSSRPARR